MWNGDGGFGGGFLTTTYYYDVMDYAGTDVVNSGSHTGTLAEAIAAAKAALGGATDWYIVVRDANGATVHSEGSDANAGQGKEPPTQGEGGAGEAGAGSGEEGAVSYTFKLTGWEWVWDDKTNADPRLWTGHATEPVIGETPGWGSDTDAYNAGKAEGDANPAACKLTVTASISGFTGKSYIWTDRLQAKQNAVAKEKGGATEDYFSEGGDLVLPPGEPPAKPPVAPGSVDEAVAIAATVAIAVTIVYVGWRAIQAVVK